MVILIASGFGVEKRTSTLCIRDKWEIELKIQISKDDFYNICKIQQQTTTSSRLWKEFFWNKNIVRFCLILPRLKVEIHLHNCQLWRMCGEKNIDHTHVFWEHMKMRKYWDDVWPELTMIL